MPVDYEWNGTNLREINPDPTDESDLPWAIRAALECTYFGAPWESTVNLSNTKFEKVTSFADGREIWRLSFNSSN